MARSHTIRNDVNNVTLSKYDTCEEFAHTSALFEGVQDEGSEFNCRNRSKLF